MPQDGGDERALPPKFTETAKRQIKELPELADAIKAKLRVLSGPGGTKLGRPLTGDLKGCQRVTIAGTHRLVYKEREDDFVVIAVAIRRRSEVYKIARRVIAGEPLPPPTSATTGTSSAKPQTPAGGKPQAKRKRKGKRGRR